MQNATRDAAYPGGGEEVGQANAPLANAHQRPRAIMAAVTPASVAQLPPLRPWQRLSVRVAGVFDSDTLITVCLVGEVLYERQKRETEATLGALLLNIARTGAYLIDPGLPMVVQRTLTQETSAYLRVRQALSIVQDENRIETPVYTLTDYDPEKRQARFMVTSRGPGVPGEPYPLVPALLEPLGRAFHDNVATHTAVYHSQSGTWITAFAPIRNGPGPPIAVLDVDYPVTVYLARLAAVRNTIVGASLLGALAALILGVIVARRVAGPITALTETAARVQAGDRSEEHTSELQSRSDIVCRLLLEKKKRTMLFAGSGAKMASNVTFTTAVPSAVSCPVNVPVKPSP